MHCCNRFSGQKQNHTGEDGDSKTKTNHNINYVIKLSSVFHFHTSYYKSSEIIIHNIYVACVEIL